MSTSIDASVYSQHGYRCRLEWGRRGSMEAAERGDILVIVDTLSFSSATATAVQHGGVIYPCAEGESPEEVAKRTGAELAVNRREVPEKGRFSLSPPTFLGIAPGTRVVLSSPNGATCSRYAGAVPHLLVGTLLNARVVGAVVSRLLDDTGLDVSLVACGERWHAPSEDGALRFAIEDYLGAGAILAELRHDKSPEALLCEGAFLRSADRIAPMLWDCASGRELRAFGYPEDVRHSARLNVYNAVPVMRDGRLESWE